MPLETTKKIIAVVAMGGAIVTAGAVGTQIGSKNDISQPTIVAGSEQPTVVGGNAAEAASIPVPKIAPQNGSNSTVPTKPASSTESLVAPSPSTSN